MIVGSGRSRAERWHGRRSEMIAIAVVRVVRVMVFVKTWEGRRGRYAYELRCRS
jgi:hypothetical protein